jgi:hypothetical protein
MIDSRIVKRNEEMTTPPAIMAGMEKETPFTVGPQMKEVVSSIAVAMPTVTTIEEKRSWRGGRFRMGLMNAF